MKLKIFLSVLASDETLRKKTSIASTVVAVCTCVRVTESAHLLEGIIKQIWHTLHQVLYQQQSERNVLFEHTKHLPSSSPLMHLYFLPELSDYFSFVAQHVTSAFLWFRKSIYIQKQQVSDLRMKPTVFIPQWLSALRKVRAEGLVGNAVTISE